jgi:hypothetical protein
MEGEPDPHGGVTTARAEVAPPHRVHPPCLLGNGGLPGHGFGECCDCSYRHEACTSCRVAVHCHAEIRLLPAWGPEDRRGGGGPYTTDDRRRRRALGMPAFAEVAACSSEPVVCEATRVLRARNSSRSWNGRIQDKHDANGCDQPGEDRLAHDFPPTDFGSRPNGLLAGCPGCTKPNGEED